MDGSIHMFRLANRGEAGLFCDERGVGLGPVTLVEKAEAKGRYVYRVRPAEEVAHALMLAYGALSAHDLSRRLSCLDVAAHALQAGEMAKAMTATLLLKLPPLSSQAFAKLAAASTLKKYSADQPRDERGRWTSGADEGAGMKPVQVAANDTGVMSDAGGILPAQVGPSPTVPSYKTEKVDQADWDSFLTALRGKDRLGEARSQQQQFIYSEIFAAEGGITPDGETVAGITPDTLHELIKNGYAIPGVSRQTMPEDLTDDQRGGAYDAYFDDLLRTVDRPTRGSKALDQIKDAESAAAFADVLLREGCSGGATMIENAVNDVLRKLPAEERQRLGLADQITVDTPRGQIGPESFNAYRTLANNGHGAALRDALANRRLAGPHAAPEGEPARIDHFRFRRAP